MFQYRGQNSIDRRRGHSAASRMCHIEHKRLSQAFHPLNRGMLKVQWGSPDSVIGTLHICRDLQRLIPTSNEARDTATRLAEAIERVMTTVSQHHQVLWHSQRNSFDNQDVRSGLEFSTTLVGGSYNLRDSADIPVLELRLHVTRQPKKSDSKRPED